MILKENSEKIDFSQWRCFYHFSGVQLNGGAAFWWDLSKTHRCHFLFGAGDFISSFKIPVKAVFSGFIYSSVLSCIFETWNIKKTCEKYSKYSHLANGYKNHPYLSAHHKFTKENAILTHSTPGILLSWKNDIQTIVLFRFLCVLFYEAVVELYYVVYPRNICEAKWVVRVIFW